MANQDVKVSALNSVSTLSTDDLSLETVVDELSATGYTSKKITEGAKASQYLEAFTFANLNTTAKTIVGAINEAATTGGSDEFIIHMTDTTVTETAADIIDAFDNGSEMWLESQITGEAVKARLPLLAYISDNSQLVLRFSGIIYANNRYRYCDVQMTRSPEQILGKQAVNVTFAVIDDATTTTTSTWSSDKIADELADKAEIADTVVSTSSVWSSQKTASELADKAEIDDTAVSSSTAWSSEQIVSLLPTESASGAVANFSTPLTLPLVSHNVTIEPVQAGSGDPSPSNPRPISGHSSVTLSHSDADTTSPTTYTRAFYDENDDPVTVYGGELDVTSGTLRVTYTEVDLGVLSWSKSSSGNKYYATLQTPYKYEQVIDMDCEIFVCDGYGNSSKGYYPTVDNSFRYYWNVSDIQPAYEIYVLCESATTVSEFKTIVEGKKLVYPLATPQTFHCEPLILDTLKGVNNIWADTGDTAIDYKQDIQTYIDNRLSSGTRSLSLAKPVEEETKQEEQEGGNNER